MAASKTRTKSSTRSTKTKAAKTAAKKTATKATPAKKKTAKRATKAAKPAKAAGKTAKPSAKKSKAADEEVKIDRRRASRRSEEKAGNEAPGKKAEAAKPKLERRQKVNRRRQIDPTTCERDYSDVEVEFMNALDDYKRASGRMFPTCSEVLEVILNLGYAKLTPAELAARKAAAPQPADLEEEVQQQAEEALAESENLFDE